MFFKLNLKTIKNTYQIFHLEDDHSRILLLCVMGISLYTDTNLQIAFTIRQPTVS